MLRRVNLMWKTALSAALLGLLVACAPMALEQLPETDLAPTDVVTVVPVATDVPTATNIPPATPTLIAVATSTPVVSVVEMDWTSTSPDGQWTATAITGDLHVGETYYTRLRVEGSTGAQVWTPVEEWRMMGLGYTLPGLVAWSADGQALYFANVPVVDGCALWVNGGDLNKLDLVTGSVTHLMPEQALNMDLSPDETRLAYVGWGERGLIIRDVAAGQEHSVSITKPSALAQLGAIQWSPDGGGLVLTIAHDPCGIDKTTSIVHVDPSTGAVRMLAEADARGLETTDWTEAGQVAARDAAGRLWWVDVVSGAVTAP